MTHRIALVAVLVLPLTASAESLPATVVARTGSTVPGIPGATYSSVGILPRLGANGHVAYSGIINGGGAVSATDFGYWAGTPDNVQLVIREDTQASGPDIFSSSTNVGVDSNGRVSLWTQLAFPIPTNMNQRLYSGLPDGGSTIIASEGSTVAPGFAGGTFSAIGSGLASNNAGAAAFTGSVAFGDAVSTSDFGLFTGTPGNLKLVAREGTSAPGASGTATVFSTLTTTIYDKRINNSGQVSFAAALSGPGIDATTDRSIYVWTPNGGNGSLALAVQTGNSAPGTSATIRFSVLDDQPGFNDAGQVAFRSGLTSDVLGEISFTNNYGIWAGTPGNIQLVARASQASPIAGLQFRTPDASPRINASGQVAFFSLVAGTGVNTTNDRVLWVTSPSGTQVAAREGSPAAGTNVNFGTLDTVSVINAAGQVAFGSTLSGSGVTTANDRGLWAGLPGALSLVAREGDVIDLDPGPGVVEKTISLISFANGFSTSTFDSASGAFNDAGQIAWQAQFTDATTAIFLTTLPDTSPTLDGDYNGDDHVDIRDYVVWRMNDGGNEAGYVLWRENYGNAASGSGHATTSVPEPGSVAIALGLLACLLRFRTHRKVVGFDDTSVAETDSPEFKFGEANRLPFANK